MKTGKTTNRILQRKKIRLAGIIALLGAVLLLTAGCGASSGSQTDSEAPMLTIVAGKAKIQAARTTYSWQNGNSGVEADGLHPLDMAKDLPILTVPKDEIATLSFDTKPDRITVLVWTASAAGTQSYGDPDYSLPVSENNTVMLPSNDRYLYQVHATWTLRDNVGGSVYYGFASAPKG